MNTNTLPSVGSDALYIGDLQWVSLSGFFYDNSKMYSNSKCTHLPCLIIVDYGRRSSTGGADFGGEH